jgi:cytochrome c peroxidase
LHGRDGVRDLLLATVLATGFAANVLGSTNPTGEARTVSIRGGVDTRNPFFATLGANNRACASCHVPADGWSIVPASIRARFEATGGTDPLFRPNDAGTSPRAEITTVAQRRSAYGVLLSKGLIRVGLPLPPGAEFELVGVDDPYGYASAAELSLFRRPLPSTNVRFLTTVMWDGRAPDLARQADDAIRRHAQAVGSLDIDSTVAIMALENSIFTAQAVDRSAGDLAADGARGGPHALADVEFLPGLRGPITLFDAWERAQGRWGPARQAVARGQALFNTRQFYPFRFPCVGCHNVPQVGSNADGAFFDLGVADAGRRTPDLPLYTLRCLTGRQVVRTTDPGRALVTGRCADIGRFKVPTLRGLAARAPYFHNGAAATLEQVVDFYDERFFIGLTAAEKADLVAFLRAL